VEKTVFVAYAELANKDEHDSDISIITNDSETAIFHVLEIAK